MDRNQRQGCDQLDGLRRAVQCTQLRPDVRAARDADADRGDPPGGAAYHPSAGERRGTADRRSDAGGAVKASQVDKKTYSRGIAMMPYDLLKEVTFATLGILAVVLVLSAVLSSPDVPSVTLQSWSKANPVDFLTTASGELSDSTVVAGYGPPYNSGSGSVQSWGPLSPQSWAGVHVPVNAPNDFVLQPGDGLRGPDMVLAAHAH